MYKKLQLNNFIVVVTLLNFSYTFHFLFSPISRCFLLCEEFLLFFRWFASFSWFFFSFLRRRLYNTWKNHYIQLQVLKISFNKKALVNIFSISNSKNQTWNLLSFVSGIVVYECLKKSVQNCFNFALISNYNTIKTIGFQNNTHLLDLSSLDVSSRVYSEPCQTSKMERFVKIVKVF